MRNEPKKTFLIRNNLRLIQRGIIRSGGLQTRKSRALEHEAELCTAPAPGVRRKCDRRAISRCSELGSVVCSLSSSPSFHGCGTACTAARVS